MVKPVETARTVDANPPTPSELRTMLGESHAAYEVLTSMHDGSTCEWKRYSKTAPWALKVSSGERTLFYINPAAGSFEVTVVLAHGRPRRRWLVGCRRAFMHPSEQLGLMQRDDRSGWLSGARPILWPWSSWSRSSLHLTLRQSGGRL